MDSPGNAGRYHVGTAEKPCGGMIVSSWPCSKCGAGPDILNPGGGDHIECPGDDDLAMRAERRKASNMRLDERIARLKAKTDAEWEQMRTAPVIYQGNMQLQQAQLHNALSAQQKYANNMQVQAAQQLGVSFEARAANASHQMAYAQMQNSAQWTGEKKAMTQDPASVAVRDRCVELQEFDRRGVRISALEARAEFIKAERDVLVQRVQELESQLEPFLPKPQSDGSILHKYSYAEMAKRWDERNHRCNILSDECGALKTENTQLLAENARLRRGR